MLLLMLQLHWCEQPNVFFCCIWWDSRQATKGLSQHICTYSHLWKCTFSFKCMQKWLEGMHQQTQFATGGNAGVGMREQLMCHSVLRVAWSERQNLTSLSTQFHVVCLKKKNDTFVIHSGWEGVIKSMQQDFTVDNSSKNIEANKLLQETALFCLLPQAQLIWRACT